MDKRDVQMKEEKIYFYSGELKISGILHTPDGKGPFPAIVLVHGLMPATDKHEFGLFDKFAPILCKEGFMVLRFDFAGHGESEGDHVDDSVEREKQNLKDAITFILKQNITNVGIIATSFGAVISVLLNDERIKALQLNCLANDILGSYEIALEIANPNWKVDLKENGYFIYKISELPENRKKIGSKIYNFIKKIDMKKEIIKLKKPVRIICAGNDKYIDYSKTKKLFEIANEPKGFFLLKDAVHNFREDKFNEMVNLSIEFFNRWLK